MKLILIAALNPRRLIGREGGLPWHYTADLKHFKRSTLGHPILAGRKTFESFQRRPLPGRPNLVLSRDPGYQVPAGVYLCHTLEEALACGRALDTGKLYAVGGAQIYRLTLPLADELLLTWVPDQVEGDTFFPQWNEEVWEVAEKREEGVLSFVTYRRKNRTPLGPSPDPGLLAQNT
ncbi:MAG: dihydrofolate reductase [Candidatus Latescibacteria bacterium]|nr:dihydrofolate reductase [Candidatus Latescibacterota bacterium]